MNLQQISVLAGEMPRIGAAAVLATGGMTPSSSEIECAFTETHLFSSSAGTEFVSGATAQAYFRQRPLSLPERTPYRALWFSGFVDGLTTFQAQGKISFSLRGSEVFALPWKIRRESATLAQTFGGSLPPFEVWRLSPADVDFVVPASGALLAGGAVTSDTGGGYRYLTTLAPRHLALTADRAEIVIQDWQMPAGGGVVSFHLAVQSQTRQF